MNQEQQKLAKKLRDEGLSYQKIAKEIGVSKYCILYLLNNKTKEYSKNYSIKNKDKKRILDQKYNKQLHVKKRKLEFSKNKYKTNFSFRIQQSLSKSKCITDVTEIINAYTGFCDICGEKEENCKIRLCIDHNHINGKFRGFLCHHCNLALGYLKDNIKIINNAAKYLQDNNENS